MVFAAVLGAGFGVEVACASAAAAERLHMAQVAAVKTTAEKYRIFITSAFPYTSTLSEHHVIVKLLSSAARPDLQGAGRAPVQCNGKGKGV